MAAFQSQQLKLAASDQLTNGKLSQCRSVWLPLTSLNVSGTLPCQPTHVYRRFGEMLTAEGGGSLAVFGDSLAVSVTVRTVTMGGGESDWVPSITGAAQCNYSLGTFIFPGTESL